MPSDYAKKQREKANLSISTKVNIVVANALTLYESVDPVRVLLLSMSDWSKVVDGAKAKSHGVTGFMIKAFDGKSLCQYAEQNYRQAVDNGLFVTAYSWLYRHDVVSPGGAAREFVAWLKDHPCNIRPCVDYEWTKSGNPQQEDLDAFVSPFAEGFGKRPMIYSAPGYVSQYLLSSVYSGDPFWQAQYKHGLWDKAAPWDHYDFLQFSQTGDGNYYGFPKDGETACELNYWRGSLQQLIDFCDIKPSTVVTPPVEEPPVVIVSPPADEGRIGEINGSKTFIHAGVQDVVHYHVISADHLKYEVVVDDHLSMTYPHIFAQKNKLEYATNGGAGWRTVTLLKRRVTTLIYGLSMYLRKGFGSLDNKWQQVYIDQDGAFSLVKPKNIYTTFPYTNTLVKGGEIQAIDKLEDYRARTAVGQRADGRIVQLVVDGGDYYSSHGMSYQEVAQMMKDLDCALAVMVDGGGSSCMATATSIIGTPSGEEKVTVNGSTYNLRPTAGHIGLRRKSA